MMMGSLVLLLGILLSVQVELFSDTNWLFLCLSAGLWCISFVMASLCWGHCHAPAFNAEEMSLNASMVAALG